MKEKFLKGKIMHIGVLKNKKKKYFQYYTAKS